MDIKQEVVYDSGTADLTFSLCKRQYIELEGVKQYIGQPERLGVAPGDFEAAENFAPELAHVFRALWTDGAIEAWKAKAAETEAQFSETP